MPESRLKIVIDALALAKGELSNLEKDLQGVEAQAKKTGGAMQALKTGKAIFTDLTGAVAGFAGTWKLAMDFGKAGAGLIGMENKFDKLATSIGTTGDRLETRLNIAMDGTISKAKMTESAVTLMNLGLAKSEDEVTRMSAVSQKLNWDMQILGLTIANESTMRLDALGLSIEDVTSRQKQLVAQGMSTSAAFREAVVAAGEAKAGLLGLDGQAGNMEKSFARLDAATTDIADSLKKKFAPWLAKSADAAALLFTWSEKLEAAQKTHADQVALTSKDYEDYTAEIARARGVMGAYIDDKGDLVNTLIGEFESTEQVIIAHAALTRAEWEQERVTAQLIKEAPLHIDGYLRVAAAAKQTAAETKTATVNLKEQEAALTNLKAVIQGAVSTEYNQFIERQTSLKERASEVKAEMDKLRSSQGAVVKEQVKNEMSATELVLAQAKLMASTEELSQAKKRAGETDAEFSLRVAQLRNDIAQQSEKLGTANQSITTYVDNSKRIGELKAEYDKANEAVAKNAKEHEEATKRIVLGFLEQRLAVDGWSQKEIDAYQNVARQLGLVDDATWTMIGGINDALGALETGTMDEFLAKIAAIKNQSLGLPSESPLPTPTQGGHVPAYQHGGSFMVPPGYPNDSYFARFSSGERVNVQPSGGDTINNNITRGGDTYIVNDARTWAMIQAQRRLETIEARYG